MEINQSRKAVVIVPFFKPLIGGVEQVAFDYACFLSKMGFAVTVLTSNTKDGKTILPAKEVINENDNILEIIRLKRLGKNHFFYWLFDLQKELRRIKPDIIHVHGFGHLPQDINLIIYKLFSKHKPKIISTPHGPFMSKKEKGIRQIIKFIYNFKQSLYLNWLLDKVIQVNPSQEQWLTKTYRINLKKISFSPPIMPGPKLDLNKLLQIKREKDYLLITSLGRLTYYKGFQDIIEVFSKLETNQKVKLIIAGASDNYEQQLMQLKESSPRKVDISIETNISDFRRDELLTKSDIFIFASEWEAFGIVTAEAMAYANAILASDTEGSKFLVKEGINGYLFKYQDKQKLTELLKQLINSPEKLTNMKRKSYEMSTEYTSEKIFAIYKQIISELLK